MTIKKWGVLLILSLILLAVTATVLVYSFETKYYFSRNECRYIFKQGSCVVDDSHCNLNSYNYVKKVLDPTKDCVSQITFNQGFTEVDVNTAPEVELPADDGKCSFQVVETDKVKIKPKAVDPDPDIGPAGKLLWTFFKPLDGKGEWQTKVGDAGIHRTKVEVSDGELKDTASFCIEVLAKNKAPVLKAIEDILVKEGETVKIDASCTDADGDKVTITYSGWMSSDSKKTGFKDAGKHSVTVTCKDPSGARDTEKVSVTVEDVNRAPGLKVTGASVYEGDKVKLDIDTSDMDGDDVTVTIADPVGDDAEWQTKEGDAGVYDVRVMASDGDKSVTKTVQVEVLDRNKAPSLKVSDVTVREGETVRLAPTVSDADGDDVKVTYSGWMTSATRKTGYDDAGEYSVTVKASDGTETVSRTVKVTVLNKNRPPKITEVTLEEPHKKTVRL
ncbi:MAG: Ig-like domain-containing protein [Candidatus Nanoarchaeia archaeon]